MSNTTTPSVPVIEGMSGKIAVLERRRDHLKRRARDPKRTGATKDFDRAEASALDAALSAMEYVRAVRGVR